MKNEKLTTDEYDALELVRRGGKQNLATACVGRNTKRLCGIKLMSFGRDKRLALTEKGEEVLFLRRCVLGLRALAADPMAAVDEDVLRFLGRKSHILPLEAGGHALSERGRESLADIDQQEERR
ncbi:MULTISPECIES: hypothetical protein [Massilia]|jgi:hypothetical protein|uniref:Uncharacterized protein n=1 Tax=Massilia timonae TaxID=47229 RepID=A0A1S2N763_9BURK|nr:MULTISPECIES: hypothetical protein [Massilia]OIJ40926.1 hypothetical protein LO55_4714 [Massilia timonae]